MSKESKQEQLELENIIREKQTIGIKRYITQITDTINFEFKRTWKTFLIMIIVYVGIFALSLLLNELREASGVELPEEPVDYIGDYFGFFGILIIISTATFGGGIIAEDFQQQTGNLLFPKISKSRLLIGRTISRYFLNLVLIILYYFLVASITIYKYGELVDTYIVSLGWALFYAFMVFTIVIFMSSINKSKSAAIIISILLFLIAFNITARETPISPIPTASHNVINPMTVKTAKDTLILIDAQIFCFIILFVFFEMSIKSTIFLRSSFIMITSAVSKVRSVAEAPIAIPRSDNAKAGASLIPSPTIPTILCSSEF